LMRAECARRHFPLACRERRGSEIALGYSPVMARARRRALSPVCAAGCATPSSRAVYGPTVIRLGLPVLPFLRTHVRCFPFLFFPRNTPCLFSGHPEPWEHPLPYALNKHVSLQPAQKLSPNSKRAPGEACFCGCPFRSSIKGNRPKRRWLSHQLLLILRWTSSVGSKKPCGHPRFSPAPGRFPSSENRDAFSHSIIRFCTRNWAILLSKTPTLP
jgi:hypothetical protein